MSFREGLQHFVGLSVYSSAMLQVTYRLPTFFGRKKFGASNFQRPLGFGPSIVGGGWWFHLGNFDPEKWGKDPTLRIQTPPENSGWIDGLKKSHLKRS